MDNARVSEAIKQIQQMKGTPVSYTDLFPDSFIQKYTSFSSIDELFDSCGFKIANIEDFNAIPQDVLNKFIEANTKFKNWQDMLNEAGCQYALKKVGF